MPTAINVLGEFVDVSEPPMLKLKPVDMDKLRAEARASQIALMRNARFGIGECEWCHKAFPRNKRRDQRYCSRKCNSRALNAKRNKERRARIDERNARIIEMRENGWRFADIAEALGISSAYAREIHSRLRKEGLR